MSLLPSLPSNFSPDGFLCFANRSVCIYVGDSAVNLTALLAQVESDILTGGIQIPPVYVGPWLAGIVISAVLILMLIVWVILEKTVREKIRVLNKKAQGERQADEMYEFDGKEDIGANFEGSSTVIASIPMKKMPYANSLLSLSGANPGKESLEIEFTNLTLTLLKYLLLFCGFSLSESCCRGHGRAVLKRVNGVLLPGKLTAILGPSGCGKTSFLATIAGRAKYGKVTGKIVCVWTRQSGNLRFKGKSKSMELSKKLENFELL